MSFTEIPEVKKALDAAEKKITPELVLNKADHILEHGKIQEILNTTVEKFDDTMVMNTIRKGWDALPEVVQKAYMFLPGPIHEFFKPLVKSGLLEVKGEDVKPEDAAKQITNWEKAQLEFGTQVANIIEPGSMEALKPLLGPIKKLMDSQANVFTNAQQHLKESRMRKVMGPNLQAVQAEIKNTV